MARRDIFQDITDKIISLLDQVDLDNYQAPFADLAAQGLPVNPVTDHCYQGVNIPSLWFDQQDKQFSSNHWATYKQWKERGAQVKKGETGSPIIFYKTLVKEQENESGDTEDVQIPMARFYTVFNADQVEGYEHREGPKLNDTDLVKRIEAVDSFCGGTGADIRHGEDSGAYYHRGLDYIHMPATIQFVDTDTASASGNYYATLLHELTHWTGASHRLDRDKAKSRKDMDKYAFEELVAELGAAFLCADLGITQSPREDHAIYLKGWLSALKDDKKYIFRASAQAARAVEYLKRLQDQ